MSTWITALRPDEDSAQRITPVSAPETIETARTELGEQVTAWCVQTAAHIVDDLEKAAEDDPSLTLNGLERQACEASVLTVISALHRGEPTTQAPAEAIEQVRLAVRQGAKIENIMRIVWACHAGAQKALLDALSRVVAPEQLITELQVLSERMIEFVDSLVQRLSETYEQERSAWHGRLAANRRRVIEQIVEHGAAPDGSEQVLGIRLAGPHLAAIVWSVDPVPRPDWDGDVMRFVADATRAMGAASSLVLDRRDGSTGVFWSFTALPETNPVATVCDGITRPPRCAVALGPVASGIAGFRDSARGAQQAALAGRRRGGEATVTYDDVGLEALLLADPDAARAFVHHMLAGLTGIDARSHALRETLRSYLRHGRSRLAAAEELHLAANTIAYRVHQAEAFLRDDIRADPITLVVALDLAAQHPDLLLSGPSSSPPR